MLDAISNTRVDFKSKRRLGTGQQVQQHIRQGKTELSNHVEGRIDWHDTSSPASALECGRGIT